MSKTESQLMKIIGTGKLLNYMMEEQGFILIPGFYKDICSEIMEEIKLMEDRSYLEENVRNHSVYISDKNETRVSHAMMVTTGESDLPTVPTYLETTKRLLQDQDYILWQLINQELPFGTRYMMNFQQYFSGSKPVAEHYDGEYLEFQKLSPIEFRLTEGLLPRYVSVITVQNENTGHIQGTCLRDVNTGLEFSPQSKPGDLLIFDNIRFRHWVPRLEKPRVMIGFRNFDYHPFYFSAEKFKDSTTEIKDKSNPGYAKEISTEESMTIQKIYIDQVFPKQIESILKEGALF